MFRRLRRTKIIALAAVALVLVYALVGFFIAPLFLRTSLETRLSTQLQRPVKVQKVDLNPFVLSLTIKGLEIQERDLTPLLGFEEFFVNVELSSIFHRALRFAEIRLVLPYGVIKIRPDGTLNLADLRPTPAPQDERPVKEEPEGDAVSSEPIFPVIIDLLHIERGILEFHDESKPTPFHADIVPLNFMLRNFRTHQDADNLLALSAEIGPGEVLEWHGNLAINPLLSDGQISLTGLHVRSLWEYFQDQVGFEIAEGQVDLTAAYHVDAKSGRLSTRVTDGKLNFKSLRLSEKGGRDTVISVPSFSIEGVEVDVLQQKVIIASVRTTDAHIQGWIDRDGEVSYQKLLAPVRTDGATQSKASVPENRPPAEPQRAWSVNIKNVAVENYGIVLEDRRPDTPVQIRLAPVTLRLANVTTDQGAKIDVEVALKVNETGAIMSTGAITMGPVSADLDLTIAQIPLKPFQPYVDQLAKLNLTGGSASIKGHVLYATQKGPARIHYTGTASINGLAIIDTQLSKDFIKWDSFAVNGVSFETAPTRLSIDAVVAQKPYARIIVAPDRTVNLVTVFRSNAPTPEATSKPEQSVSDQPKNTEPMSIKIKAVRIMDGSMNFADFSLRPVVDTGIQELRGTVKGLSSEERTKADVSLEGKVDRYAPVMIVGQINPLSSEAYTDLAVSFKNVELMKVSPYSTKFAGYPIKKGKLSMDLKYQLSKKVLVAENKIVIDHLTLGDKIDSPDATSLPVKLAIALLKDRNGRIDIDLPVRGDLNDPEFHYGRLLLNVFVNLLTKAVTSPFSAIARLFGGGEESSEVHFAPGSALLDPEEEKKLDALTKALEDRPALRLDIASKADPQKDRVALAEGKLRQEVQNEKQEQLRAGNNRSQGLEEGDLTDAEYFRLLKAVYAKKFKGTGTHSGGLSQRAGHDESDGTETITAVKQQLLQTVSVGEKELQTLAHDRAKTIQTYLIERTGVPAERIYLLESKVEPSSKNEKVATPLALSAE